MKKISLLSLIAATTLFATNGDHLIGLGVESRALGGTGLAAFNGAENALTNPALLSKTKVNKEFSLGGTLFNSNVKVSTTTATNRKSAQDISMIPVVALSTRINKNLVFGLGMYGTAGMGTDWRATDWSSTTNSPGLYNMRSSLMLMQFAPSIAYSKNNWGIGITTIMQFGQLSIDFDSNATNHIGNGTSQDFGYGFQLGGFYDLTQNFTVGAVYKSAIDMKYKNQITDATKVFGLSGFTDNLEQPAEFGIGFAHRLNRMTYTIDIKSIQWGDAKGYKEFGWKNQTVYALGAKFEENNYWWGVGFNHASNPIPNNTDATKAGGGLAPNSIGDTLNLANYAMFPATVENHYTIGGGYDLTKTMSIAGAFTYAPAVSDTVSGATVGVGQITTKHSQSATTIAIKYKF